VAPSAATNTTSIAQPPANRAADDPHVNTRSAVDDAVDAPEEDPGLVRPPVEEQRRQRRREGDGV